MKCDFGKSSTVTCYIHSVEINENHDRVLKVRWKNMTLIDQPSLGFISFGLNLFWNGEIQFYYYEVPANITSVIPSLMSKNMLIGLTKTGK